MNLRNDPEKTIKALVAVEGKDWLKDQKHPQWKDVSVYTAIQKLRQVTPTPSTADAPVAVIYGREGWNRYRVLASGDVEFLELLSFGPEDIEKARQAGFRIF